MRQASISGFAGLFLGFIFMLALAGCNSGSSGTATGSGQVAVLLTDGPTEEFDQVNVAITQIKLLGAEHGQVSIFEGHETVNLLDLRSHSTLFALADVPAGSYEKIRLIVDDISLVRFNGPGVADDEVYHPKLPGNGKIDLNPRSTFEVIPGATLYLQLDLDAEKSIHIVGAGKDRYRFRPVVFVDIVTDHFMGKLVRVSGTVRDMDDVAGTFSLCSVSVAVLNRDLDDDDGYCMRVSAGDQASFFHATGEPALFDDLVNGEQATVIGRFDLRHDDDADDDDGDDMRHLDDDHLLALDALVVELAAGDVFKRVSGVVDTVSLPDNQFEMTLDPGQFVSADSLLVQLMSGVKVFSVQGQTLTVEDIVVDARVKVEGILALSDVEPDMIKAAAVFLAQPQPMAVVLEGEVTAIHADLMRFEMSSQLGDRCVQLDADSDLYEISLITGGGFDSSEIGLGDLAVGQAVTVYGTGGTSGCVLADDVLAEGADLPISM